MYFKKIFSKYFNLTAKNIGIIFVASSIVNIINFFYQMIMGRLLGPSEYGVLTTLISLLYIAGAITGTFQTSVTRNIAAYNAQNNKYKIKNFFNKITIRLFILACFIFILLVSLLKPIKSFLNMESSLPFIILGVVIILGSLNSVAAGIIQGMGRFKILGFNSILGTSLKLLLGVLFIYLGFKSFGAVIGIMLSMAIAYLIILLSIKDILRLKIFSNIDSSIDIKDFYKSTTMILISTILLTLISYIDIVLVKHFFSSENTGYFSAASQIGRIILFFPGAIGIVIFSRLSEKFEKKESLRGTFLKSYLILLVTSIFFLLLYFFFPELITRIIYGGSFINATSKLIFLYGVFMTIIGFINLQILYFISVKKFWYLIYFFIFIAVEIVLIFNYHDTLKMVLWIEIMASIIVFLINTIIMLMLSKTLKTSKTQMSNYYEK
jgi:O-antigen/teichoic acid export membrane protein